MAIGAGLVVTPAIAVPGMATGAIGSSIAGAGGMYAGGDIGIAIGAPYIGAAIGGIPP